MGVPERQIAQLSVGGSIAHNLTPSILVGIDTNVVTLRLELTSNGGDELMVVLTVRAPAALAGFNIEPNSSLVTLSKGLIEIADYLLSGGSTMAVITDEGVGINVVDTSFLGVLNVLLEGRVVVVLLPSLSNNEIVALFLVIRVLAGRDDTIVVGDVHSLGVGSEAA